MFKWLIYISILALVVAVASPSGMKDGVTIELQLQCAEAQLIAINGGTDAQARADKICTAASPTNATVK